MSKKDILWRDRKRTIFGLPLSFTVYSLTGEKLLIETGFLNKMEEEILLFRINDLKISRSFFQRIFGIGTIHCCSSDSTTPELDIVNIKNPKEVRELLSDEVAKDRKDKGITMREVMYDSLDDEH